MLLWALSLAQPYLLHILHSAGETDCSLEECLPQCETRMCKIYHGGVRNFNLCFQNQPIATARSEVEKRSFFSFFVTLYLLLFPLPQWVVCICQCVQHVTVNCGVRDGTSPYARVTFEDLTQESNKNGDIHLTKTPKR